jgi:putative nucleotidyltransferase with HDIG domain
MRSGVTDYVMKNHLAKLAVAVRRALGEAEIRSERRRYEDELQSSLRKTRALLEQTIHSLASVVEMRDPYTAGHQRQVSLLSEVIAIEMGLDHFHQEAVRMAGFVHDIGKIGVPAEILSKPSRLSEWEMYLIKTHSQTGHQILKEIEFPWPIAQITLQHHERLDGSGYPYGLRGEEVLIEARILAVADVVDAMNAHRPYRPSRGIEPALREIEDNAGTLYDPNVVDACLKIFQEKNFNFFK